MRRRIITTSIITIIIITITSSCTFVYVEGDNNRFNDTGGDLSGKLERAQGAKPASDSHVGNAPHLLH